MSLEISNFSIQIKSQSMPSTVDTTSDSSSTRDFSEMDFSRMSLQELKQSIRSKPTAKRKWLNRKPKTSFVLDG